MRSVNKKEIEKFSNMAAEWWDPEGKFKPLHKFNPIRIKYIKENIIKSMVSYAGSKGMTIFNDSKAVSYMISSTYLKVGG